MSFAIWAIGTAIPTHSIEQNDAAELSKAYCCQTNKQGRLLAALYKRAGVSTRHSVILDNSSNGTQAKQSFYPSARSAIDRGPTTQRRMQSYERNATPLACQAASSALQLSGKSADQITHLITVSCSGFAAPGFDIALIKQLALSPNVARTHVGFMGCHGAFNGLRVAKAFTDANPNACILLCSLELCSLHQHYGWYPNKIVSNALFADGAAAVVGGTAASESRWVIDAHGSMVLPDSEDVLQWQIGDHGFEMSLSPRLPQLVDQYLREWLESWLREHKLSIDDIRSWAVHPGGPRVLNATSDALGLDQKMLDTSRKVLAKFGNMSSPTVLFILQEMRRSQAPMPCVMLGFGPGLTIEAALVR